MGTPYTLECMFWEKREEWEERKIILIVNV